MQDADLLEGSTSSLFAVCDTNIQDGQLNTIGTDSFNFIFRHAPYFIRVSSVTRAASKAWHWSLAVKTFTVSTRDSFVRQVFPEPFRKLSRVAKEVRLNIVVALT
jgi:hypothetical protein